jgi:predicted DNA-binding protein
MAELAAPQGDWDDMNIDDVAIKMWIPDVLDECLDTLSERFEQSKSDLARNGLMIHVYGRYVFEQLVANRLWKLTRRIEKELVIKYSMGGLGVTLEDDPRPAYIKAFGKNTCDLKVWMPMKLKDNLANLGFHAGQTTSEYMRRAMTAYYLGRTVMDPLK